MANVQILPKVGENDRREWRITDAGVTDADVGKPVGLDVSDVVSVELAADGDLVYGFVDSVEQGTDGGKTVVTVLEQGSCRVTASGTIAKGALVEAAANTAAGTASVAWGIVSSHTAAAGEKNWMALTAAADGEMLVIQKV